MVHVGTNHVQRQMGGISIGEFVSEARDIYRFSMVVSGEAEKVIEQVARQFGRYWDMVGFGAEVDQGRQGKCRSFSQ